MWKEFDEGGFLEYKNFLETVVQILPMYWMRAIGGTLYVIGALMMVVNLIKTIQRGKLIRYEEAEAPAMPQVYKKHKNEYWHRWIERRPVQMLVASLVLISIGGLIEMVPTFMVESNVPKIAAVQPYTPLELQGRDVYIREGCYVCHSQMIRPFRSETERYGPYSKSGEFVYDHPFQWGSKRTGPDLAREGWDGSKQKRSNYWHWQHMLDPRTVEDRSIMPSYPWLFDTELDIASTPKKIRVMQTLGVPYEEGYDQQANEDLTKQAVEIADDIKKELTLLKRDPNAVVAESEIIALIAYLQRLGKDGAEADK